MKISKNMNEKQIELKIFLKPPTKNFNSSQQIKERLQLTQKGNIKDGTYFQYF